MNIDVFLDVEKKYNLYQARVDDVFFWNYARVHLWNYEICAQKMGLLEPHGREKKRFLKKLENGLVMAGHVAGYPFRLKKADYLFFTHARKILVDGTYRCIYTEALAEQYQNVLLFEDSHGRTYFTPSSNLPRIYGDRDYLLSNAYYYLHKKTNSRQYRSVKEKVRQMSEAAVEELCELYGVDLDRNHIYEIFTKHYFQVKYRKRSFGRMLDKVQPKMIFEVVYYGQCNMVINELAKERNIPTVELQHGTMHDAHAAYIMWTNDLLPQLPDQLFLFSDFWRHFIRLPIREENMITTGFPYFERQKAAYLDVKRSLEKKQILFISQGTIGGKLSRFALELSQALSPEEYMLVYKLHPSEYSVWKERYPWLLNSGIRVIDSVEPGLYSLFAASHIQIGVYSTAVYEGLGFGLRTYILNVGHADTMQMLVDAGYADYIASCEDFLLLEKQERFLDGKIEFWKENSIENMKKAVENLKTERKGQVPV